MVGRKCRTAAEHATSLPELFLVITADSKDYGVLAQWFPHSILDQVLYPHLGNRSCQEHATIAFMFEYLGAQGSLNCTGSGKPMTDEMMSLNRERKSADHRD